MIKVGTKFRSIHISQGVNICEVVGLNENVITVKVTGPRMHYFADWDLDKTIEGFKNNEYTLIK